MFLAVGLASCDGGEEPFAPPEREFLPIAIVGGAGETNPLFQFVSPIISLADTATVAYTDARTSGRLVVAHLRTGEGWERRDPAGAVGPGELGGGTPLVSPVADTLMVLTPSGRLSARHRDGTLVFDSVLSEQRPGPIFLGVAGHSRVTVDWERRIGASVVLRLESPKGSRDIAIGAIEVEEEVDTPGVVGAARGDLIVHGKGNVLHTRDHLGRELATVVLPWRIFNVSIDGSRRVWAQVYGGVPEGQNLVVLDAELSQFDLAVIDGFRDAYGDYVLTLTREGPADRLTLLRVKDW